MSHLCATGNTFIAPTTFPNALFAKGSRVCLRYTAEGHHKGEPNGDMPPTGKKAQWSASALFKVEAGKLVEFIKDWNKLSMWERFG